MNGMEESDIHHEKMKESSKEKKVKLTILYSNQFYPKKTSTF